MKNTNARTINVKSNDNISFPVGTAFAVKKYSSKLCFDDIFSNKIKIGLMLSCF